MPCLFFLTTHTPHLTSPFASIKMFRAQGQTRLLFPSVMFFHGRCRSDLSTNLSFVQIHPWNIFSLIVNKNIPVFYLFLCVFFYWIWYCQAWEDITRVCCLVKLLEQAKVILSVNTRLFVPSPQAMAQTGFGRRYFKAFVSGFFVAVPVTVTVLDRLAYVARVDGASMQVRCPSSALPTSFCNVFGFGVKAWSKKVIYFKRQVELYFLNWVLFLYYLYFYIHIH